MNLLRHSRIITTKTTKNKWRRPMMIVIVFGEREEKNGRGETNISKVNQWRTSCSMRTKQRRNKANKDNQCMAEYTHVLFSLASAKTLARRSRGVGGLCKMYATLLCVFRFAVFFNSALNKVFQRQVCFGHIFQIRTTGYYNTMRSN